MAEFLTNLGMLAGQNRFLAYFIIYIATIFLGNVSAFIAFWLVFRGFFGQWGVLFLVPTIFLANMSGDLLWYFLGQSLRNTTFGNFVRNRLPQHEKIEANLRKNGSSWVFVSKFLYASSFPVIFSVGWVGVEFRKFFRVSLLSISVWVPILTGIAYGLISGLTPLGAIAVFRRFEIIFLIGLVLFFVVDYFLARWLKKFLSRFLNGMVKEEEESTTPPG